jgi:Protein of unknown function (DUF2911)
MISFKFLAFLILPISLFAQESNRISPLDVVSARYKDTYLKIVYSQPHKRGRDVYGKLVPYGSVWRTGANEATELTVTKDCQIHGLLLKSGTYSLFTIPNKDQWTIILNADLGLWGSYNYNQKTDIFRFEVPALKSDSTLEAFTIMIKPHNETAEVILGWDKVYVAFPIQFLEPKP